MVLIVIALVAAAGFGLFRLFMEDLRYSKKRTDLTQYLGITAQDDAAIILNHELLTEYAKLQNGRLYFRASQVSTMLNKRFYYSAADGTVRYCLPDQIIETVAGERADVHDAALDELKAMIEADLGGTVTKHIASAENPEVVIEE